MKSIILAFVILSMSALPLVSSAHWIAGYVENALDSTSPDGRTVRLWNPSNSQEVFGIIGPSGPSGTSNVYMIDCEALTTPCLVGDSLNLTVVDDGSGYNSKNIVSVQVTGAGFDSPSNLSLNTPPSFVNLTVEDAQTSPENEIDLTPATTTTVTCSGVIQDSDGGSSIQSVLGKLFSSSSSYAASDDNNDHYTNSSCQVNSSYGTSTQAAVSCSFEIEYYSNPGSWECRLNVTDNYSSSSLSSDLTSINTLLALGVNPSIFFGEVNANKVSPEAQANITNYGNVQMNLTLSGYGQTPGDGKAMECGDTDIAIDYMKFNLTDSNSSNLTLQQFESIYQNLTSSPVSHSLNLNSRENDVVNDVNASTYWRVYVPQEISDSCLGNVVFGATQG